MAIYDPQNPCATKNRHASAGLALRQPMSLAGTRVVQRWGNKVKAKFSTGGSYFLQPTDRVMTDFSTSGQYKSVLNDLGSAADNCATNLSTSGVYKKVLVDLGQEADVALTTLSTAGKYLFVLVDLGSHNDPSTTEFTTGGKYFKL